MQFFIHKVDSDGGWHCYYSSEKSKILWPSWFEKNKNNIFEKNLGKIMNMPVYIVNGFFVRDNIDTQYYFGGHPLIYPYIKNAFWLEKTEFAIDLFHNIQHEIDEFLIMKYGKIPYDPAHYRASAIEGFQRMFLEMLIKEGKIKNNTAKRILI